MCPYQRKEKKPKKNNVFVYALLQHHFFHLPCQDNDQKQTVDQIWFCPIVHPRIPRKYYYEILKITLNLNTSLAPKLSGRSGSITRGFGSGFRSETGLEPYKKNH
jgi:hypothetical protein